MTKQDRRTFFKKMGLGFISFSFLENFSLFSRPGTAIPSGKDAGVHFTTGFKIAEVTPDSTIIWTRLCNQANPNPITHEREYVKFLRPVRFDENKPIADMDGGVEGKEGFVRVKLRNRDDNVQSEWVKVAPENDFTAKVPFGGLKENTSYEVEIEGRTSSSGPSSFIKGSFKTAPDPGSIHPVNLVTATCQYFWNYDDEKRGFKTYDSMRRLKPDFFIHTGDYVYYDRPGPFADTIQKARHQWRAMDSRLSIRDLYREVPMYVIKDDHDTLKDDAYPSSEPYGQLSFEDGLKVWHENVALRDKPYRTIRWGRDLQIWMVEGREYRSANTMKDGPGKSIWGQEQISWFRETVESSTATFKILFSATPVVGPDRDNKKDNHANKVFHREGEWLRQYLSGQKGMFVVNGDRHWQYVSRDAETGLMEFGSGPVCDAHAGGWSQEDVRPEHRFLRVKGGFLNIRVERKNGKPAILFRHHDVDGHIVNTYTQTI